MRRFLCKTTHNRIPIFIPFWIFLLCENSLLRRLFPPKFRYFRSKCVKNGKNSSEIGKNSSEVKKFARFYNKRGISRSSLQKTLFTLTLYSSLFIPALRAGYSSSLFTLQPCGAVFGFTPGVCARAYIYYDAVAVFLLAPALLRTASCALD